MNRVFKCLRCDGTGRMYPRRPGAPRDLCPECNGTGDVKESSAWAGWVQVVDHCHRTYDFCRRSR